MRVYSWKADTQQDETNKDWAERHAGSQKGMVRRTGMIFKKAGCHAETQISKEIQLIDTLSIARVICVFKKSRKASENEQESTVPSL
jgi:hypothetical protein